jgi:putative hemolysin
MARAARSPANADGKAITVIAAIAILALAAIPLLAVITTVQLLYLESLRLRPRDLPSLAFFKDVLDDKLGLKADDGAGAFSLVKHTILALSGVLYFAWVAYGSVWNWAMFWQSALAVWLTMVVASYAIPQLLYRRTKGRWLVPLVPVLRFIAALARPGVAILGFYQSLMELAGDSAGEKDEPSNAENVDALITAGTEEGLIQEDDRRLIQSVVEFGDKVAREVMTPRPGIVAIQADATLEQLRNLVINEQYSRIPAYEQNIDQIIGFVHVRDMFEIDEEERESRTVRELVRNVLFVPETKPVSELMRQMQQENTHMVVVVDEYGNTAGLATMEDLLEVIIGEIRDEHEPASDVVEDGNGGYIVSGSFDVDRVGDLVGNFHKEEDLESTTVGGMVSEWLGRVPRTGEFVERDGVRIEVTASDELHIGQVRITKSSTVTHE